VSKRIKLGQRARALEVEERGRSAEEMPDAERGEAEVAAMPIAETASAASKTMPAPAAVVAAIVNPTVMITATSTQSKAELEDSVLLNRSWRRGQCTSTYGAAPKL